LALITRQSIENLKLHINIYDVVAREVQLKRAGRNWVGLSPFQNEKTPSFNVLPERGIFKCFSTGLAGDIFKFVQELEHVTFVEAVELLAERFNQPLEYEKGAGPKPEERSLKRQLLELHEYAADYYHEAFLADHPEAAECRAYWTEKRGFPLDLAKEFKIGFAPVKSQKLNQRLIRKGFTEKALRDCGLFYARDYDPDPLKFRPRFRGRLMVPIRDRQGQIIAFTARQLELTPEDDPAHQAKYINSPGTPLFSKSHILFNLERAREAVRETQRFVMVEGQLDAIRCWHEGVRETIAPQGTSITPEQLALLRPFTTKLTVVLDGDKAGQKAALRMLPLALGVGLELHFAALPAEQDPDSFLQSQGADAFQELLDQAEAAMPFTARALLPDNASAQDRAQVIQELAQILAPCESDVARIAYFEEAIEVLPLDAVAARHDFDLHLSRILKRAKPIRNEASLDSSKPKQRLRPAAPTSKKLTNAEADLVVYILHHEDYGAPLAEVLDPAWLNYEATEGRLLGWLTSELAEGQKLSELEPRASLENEADIDAYFQLLAQESPPLDPEVFINAQLEVLYKRHLDRKKQSLAAQIANLEGDFEKQMELQKKLSELRKDLQTNQVPVLRNLNPSTS
jgi:DNA primase|tara:strand:- start:135484 stop:137370 length:1887 start_codon:yes stop_codon:yes gene_type:complete